MLIFRYSLKRDYPEWTNQKRYDENKLMQQLKLQELIDKIKLSIETLENDEIVAFELTNENVLDIFI